MFTELEEPASSKIKVMIKVPRPFAAVAVRMGGRCGRSQHGTIRFGATGNIQGYEYIHTSQDIMGQLPEFSVHAQRTVYRHRKVAGSGPRSPAITSGSRSITLHFLVWGELWIRTPLVDVAHGVDIVFPSYR